MIEHWTTVAIVSTLASLIFWMLWKAYTLADPHYDLSHFSDEEIFLMLQDIDNEIALEKLQAPSVYEIWDKYYQHHN